MTIVAHRFYAKESTEHETHYSPPAEQTHRGLSIHAGADVSLAGKSLSSHQSGESDGRKCGEFRQINWRSAGELRVNKVQLSLWLEPQSYTRAGGGHYANRLV